MKIENTLKKLLFILILIFSILLLVPKSVIGITEDNLRESNINGYREAVVERVEKVEKLVSREYWDWWTWVDTTSVSNSATLTNISVQKPNIEVQKSVITTTGSNNLVYAGEEVTYEINITNNGTRTEENIEVIDQIPQNTTFVSINDENTAEEILDENNNVIGIKWHVTVEPEETVTVSFTVRVNENVEGTITNTAMVNGKESNETHTAIIQNEKSSVITRNGEEVKIAKVGDQVTYTITAINTGDVAGAISVQDAIPEGTILVSAEGATISENNKTLTWENVNVPAGGSASVEFIVEVEKIDGEITNTAIVGGKETEENKVPTAEIEITKEVTDITRDGASVGKDVEVTEGDIIEYTITVTNKGSVELTNIVIEEELAGIEIETGSLNIASLPAGTQQVITATYTVTYENDIQNKTEKEIYNKVIVTGEYIADPENPNEIDTVEDEDEVSTTVEEMQRVSVTKGANKNENVKVGETIRYTIRVQNIGNVSLQNIEVEDIITTSAGTFNITVYSDIDCTIETTRISRLRVGETATLYAKYTVTQEDIDTQTAISNIATAKPEKAEEPTPSEPVETTTEATVPAIDISKTATAIKKNGEIGFTQNIDRVRPGDVIEYTIIIRNTGNVTLNNIIVTDSLKVTVNGDEKEVDNATGVSTIATINSLAPYTEPVTITALYTVTEADTANLDRIRNTAIAIAEDGTTDRDDNETVSVNRDTSVTVNKIWVDNNDQDGKRPDTITINLYADGEQIQTQTITGTTYTFTKLPTYNEAGNVITYTVTENAIQEYTTTYSEDTFTITNTHIPETTSVTVRKTWDDNNDQDRMRPDSVSVSLSNGVTEVNTQTLSNANNWTYTFTNLPKYSNGTLIPYTVVENNVPEGYTAEVTGSIETGFTITNAHTPNLINISVTKVWEDNNNHYGARTPIEVTLNANGVESQTVTITEADNWQHTFERVPEYENGVKINYTITETPVEGYQTTITGDVETGFTITNKYNNITVNKMTLVDSETTQREVGLDVVFVLDISGSMRFESNEGIPKVISMVNAVNKAMTEIMKDRNNKVGIVLFTTDATVLLPLNVYTARTTSNGIGQYIQYTTHEDADGHDLYFINANVTGMAQNTTEVTGDESMQIGLAKGADMLLQQEDTENRQPITILLSDGVPWYSTTEYDNVTSDNCTEIYQDFAINNYLTILTANYYKNKVTEHYKDAEALMYTIGFDLTSITAQTLLNPSEENVNACIESGQAEATTLYNYLTGIEYIINGKEVRNPYTEYNYADGAYIGEMTAEELDEIFAGIIEEINKVYETTTIETSNINMDVSKIELENLDTNENITITIDDQTQEYTIDELLALLTVVQEGGKYYMDLKSDMFTNVHVIDITYYEVSESIRRTLTGYSLLSPIPLLGQIREYIGK